MTYISYSEQQKIESKVGHLRAAVAAINATESYALRRVILKWASERISAKKED